jgi:hypothetical protein
MKTINVVVAGGGPSRQFSVVANSFTPVDIVQAILRRAHPLIDTHPDYPSFIAHFLKEHTASDQLIRIRLGNVEYSAMPDSRDYVFIVSVKTNSDEYREIRVRAESAEKAMEGVKVFYNTVESDPEDQVEVMDIVGVDPAETPAMICYH